MEGLLWSWGKEGFESLQDAKFWAQWGGKKSSRSEKFGTSDRRKKKLFHPLPFLINPSSKQREAKKILPDFYIQGKRILSGKCESHFWMR